MAPDDEDEPLGSDIQHEPFPSPPILPKIGRFDGEGDGGAQTRPSIEPQRLSVAVFDPDALSPLFFSILFLGTLAGCVYVLSGFIADVVLAFIIVGLFGGLYERTRRRLGGRAVLASALITVLVALIVIGPILGFGYTIVMDAADTYSSVSMLLVDGGADPLDRLIERLAALGVPISRDAVLGFILDMSGSIQQTVVAWGTAILGNALSITVHLATVLVMVFYVLIDGHRLRAFLFDLSPLPDDEDALIVETFMKVSRGVVVGNGLGSAIQGLLGGVAMAAAGFASPVLWGSVMAFFAFLPLVGISLVAIPASLYLAFLGHTGTALAFFAFCTLMGVFVENVVKTRLMGSAMRMHDLLVFLSILGGIASFGLMGLVFGPLIAMLFMTLSELYQKRYRPRLAAHLARRY